MVASGHVTLSRILAKRRCHIYPTSTGRIPGSLSSTIIQPEINSGWAAKGGLPLASHLTKFSTLVHSILLSSPNFRNHPCSASDSVPPGPELTKSFCATDSTASSVVSTGIKIGVYPYVSNVAQGGFFSLGCFPSKTNVTALLIVTVQSIANSSGCKTLPFSPSHTNCMAPRNFPFRTRIEKI